jgi:hypothetical protein
VQALRQADRGFSVMFDPLGEFLSDLEAVIQPVLRSRCRNVGQELLYLYDVELDVLRGFDQRDRSVRNGIGRSRTEMKVNPVPLTTNARISTVSRMTRVRMVMIAARM